MSRFLVILEVSQKQAYIFGSNKVADNIVNSAVIAKCLSPDYIGLILGEKYNEEINLVYSGGGHTILEYDDRKSAEESVFLLTERIYEEFDGLEVFAKICEYQESMSPKDNLKALSAGLEAKKALRRSGFHHGSFGVEEIDSNTLKPVVKKKSEAINKIKKEEYTYTSKSFIPEGYEPVFEFEKLGMEKNRSSFIAVVHIDGNGMGKRVDELYECIDDKNDWNSVKKALRVFSDSIDDDFKSAYKEMSVAVARSIEEGELKGKIKLHRDKDSGKYYFPVRRIITAGDDICFVTEGRIGLECSRIFIEKLSSKTNKADRKGYSACAGIAIVHQKYPFYKAYELAEKLCSNAKKEGASISPDDDGRNACLIDWHIEYGEIKDSIDDIRRDYIADDGSVLTHKPYVIRANKETLNKTPEEKKYDHFKRNIRCITNCEKDFGGGVVKQLRSVMKSGKTETDNFISFHRLEDRLNATFYKDKDSGKNKNTFFDAIEMMDTFFLV